jgi:hypothetical protein
MSKERANAVSTPVFLPKYLRLQKEGKTRDEIRVALGMNENSFNTRLSAIRKLWVESFQEKRGPFPEAAGSQQQGRRLDIDALDALVADVLGPANEETNEVADSGDEAPQAE